MLSMIEHILRVSKNTADIKLVENALLIGKEVLDKPVSLMEGMEDVLVRIGKSNLTNFNFLMSPFSFMHYFY